MKAETSGNTQAGRCHGEKSVRKNLLKRLLLYTCCKPSVIQAWSSCFGCPQVVWATKRQDQHSAPMDPIHLAESQPGLYPGHPMQGVLHLTLDAPHPLTMVSATLEAVISSSTAPAVTATAAGLSSVCSHLVCRHQDNSGQQEAHSVCRMHVFRNAAGVMPFSSGHPCPLCRTCTTFATSVSFSLTSEASMFL